MTRARLTATVDDDLLAAARAAVAEGRAASVSEWVGAALRRHTEHDGRLRAMDDFLAAYDAEHDPLPPGEGPAPGTGWRARLRLPWRRGAAG